MDDFTRRLRDGADSKPESDHRRLFGRDKRDSKPQSDLEAIAKFKEE